ncbi:alpha,alpha-trehalose-phosphate synthase [UDP-forming] 1 isoform X1 [Vigna unguiculata]|uniref:alpha,alpha-trehalose-phosphate synthase (UDP-forming) n=1 Tax=Vigna unguiculata TaxID=3917 RepID=A0A4D6NDJ2_VIGUN|nr:alpha,alpha-trehalose-phosphate synthase [UDP-forming] 1 isoform X1 [Vigna unguiculata]XP_027928575.1 alpha,alpha-trehalose-phosphate synthase [UDP-forming] 1 isoform X1 [Vigna unguiculata]XP_027928576.1 alpha,alpha-trehalose-phosphate synthase [UDP-forming] 1 isoform X1 [Vigna unguiculata]XP_027928577.1 alpha,alpha-trehalose-phosphate synthase [UDP-forming] 1 isoform X1 [Vigna unguiculata]XP_027928578.1 alpha,alpha-trehalose-phosphate synthase [UDP-forming] 1 isoform X1 [Vigna unguiculata]
MVGFHSDHKAGNKFNGNSNIIPDRVERLMRRRELFKSSKASLLNEAPDSNNNNNNVITEYFEHDPRLREDNNSAASYERLLEGVAAAVRGEREDGRPFKQRLLVVANRLPVSAIRKGEDSWSLEISAGGLVSALLGVKALEARWIGWAGVNVPDEIGQKALTKALAEKRCIPVFLDEEIVHQYYNGYCNNILWPLFHYLGLPQEDRLATTRSFQSQFEAYQKANQMFADVVNKHYEEGDVVWCHDYHLMFLPQCLKNYNPKMKVGWFLHTPFPSSEIHRTLPSRSELLHAVLAADLVGFHTYDYARHFVSACTRILGLEGTPEGVENQGKLTRVAAFPIGIDSERFIRALDLPQVKGHIKELQERFKGRKVMLGVDRLDMIKGIPQKILAFEKFLEENPDWRDKVVLLQIAVPTRTDVPEYQKLTSQVHEIVGRINGRFGTLATVPIHHLDCSLDFHKLCALYAVTDVALVTSLRDGMNLVSYEFVACQDKKKGVLILSEFAGAAQSLGAGAILVNPWNITEVAAAIDKALNMKSEEREKRHKHNFKHVTTHTAQEWAETFVSELNDTIDEAQLRTKQVPPRLPMETAVERYLQSNNRLIILGFNGTLTVPVERKGDQYQETELTVHPELKQPLAELCSDPKTTVVVLSGSGRPVLDQNFKEYDIWLAAENGMFLNPSKGEWMTTMPEQLNMEWVDSVKHVFDYFTDRTPRSHFEEREASLVWSYRHSDVEFGRLQARDMLQHLWTGPISNASVEVVQGSRSVEVRAANVTKGAAIDRILGEIVHSKSMTTPIDYVLCIGHFLTKQDEDIYAFFEPELPSIGVGLPRSKVTEGVKFPAERISSLKIPASKNGAAKSSQNKGQRVVPNSERKTNNHVCRAPRRPAPEKISWNVLDLKKENYFSCAVGRTQTNARYTLGSPDEVVSFLNELVNASPYSYV